jgi:hypothetical protein
MENHTSATAEEFGERRPAVQESAIREAQRIVGLAMGACLAMWFAPIVSGIACNIAEKKMVRELLSVLGSDTSDCVVSNLFWFFRKKFLVLNGLTYVPFAGTSFQLVEVYGMGQFTIHCAAHFSDVANEQHLAESWKAVEGEILSGERVVRSYEQFTGKSFPLTIKTKFIPAVDLMRDIYLRAERIPGVEGKQEKAGQAMREALNLGTTIMGELIRRARQFGK